MIEKRIRSVACVMLWLFVSAWTVCGTCCAQEAYVFTSFREPSTEGLRYLYSTDGLCWDTIPGVWLKPEVGAEGKQVLRDPSIAKGADGTYHLVWTSQWYGTKGFGYAHSKDLIHWSEQREINVMQDEEVDNVWAPELFYLDEDSTFLIVWSSKIPREQYTAADSLGTNASHRMWYSTTKDFVTFTKAQRYYDPGFNSIDGFLVKRAEKDYVLIVKDNRKPGFSNLFCVFSDSPYGPFSSPSETFGRTYSEGPCAIKYGEGWIIYYDQYKPQEYGAVYTTDFRHFTPFAEKTKVPQSHKHGTIVKVDISEINKIRDEP